MDESDAQRPDDGGPELHESDTAPTTELPASVPDPTAEQAVTPPTPAPAPLFPAVFTSGEPESPVPTPPVGTPPVTPPIGFPRYPYPFPPAGQVPPGGGFALPGPAGPGGSGGGPSWLPPYNASDGWYQLGAPMPEQPPHRGRRGVALLLVAALVAGGVGAALGSAFSNNATPSNALLTPPSTSPPTASTTPPTGALSTAVIARLVSPSVVNIETVVATPSGEPQQQAAGTGMIVSSDGIILTNNHVVEDAQSIRVAIAGHGTYPATVLGTAKSSDVALIKVSGLSGLPPISLGNSSAVAVGQSVVALGNALGLDGPPSTAPGYISGVGQSITANGDGPSPSSETLHGLLETNAQIQPGDSGGPLVNSKGQVIGMDTAAASGDTGSSLGFAIPINTARSIALDIEHHDATTSNGIVIGLTPYIGVWLGESGTAGNSFGAFGGGQFGLGTNTGTCASNSGTGNTGVTGVGILYVTSGGPSAKAGLTSGDVITAIAGHPTTSATGLEKVVGALKSGQTVSVAYTDSCGTAHTTSVTVGGIPA